MVAANETHRNGSAAATPGRRGGRSAAWRAYDWVAIASVVTLLAISLWSVHVYRQENNEIRRRVERLTVDGEPASETVRRVARHLVERVPARRVDDYFLLPCFRMLKPSALQILDGGGDCAYKARAFIVMLKHAGIGAYKLALHDDQNVPVHAVAVAETEKGPIIVDLRYGIVFEDEQRNPIALESLANDPHCLVDVIRREIDSGNVRAAAYDVDRYNYRVVRTINWDKTWITARARDVLSTAIGPAAVDRIPRPRLAEEPALMVLVLTAAGFLLVGSPYIIAWSYERFFAVGTCHASRGCGKRSRVGSPAAAGVETPASG